MKVILSDMRHPVRAHHPETQFAPQLLRCDCRKGDRKSTRLNSSHSQISYAVFCLKKKKLCSSRSQEHTSELHSNSKLVCRLRLEREKQRLHNEAKLSIMVTNAAHFCSTHVSHAYTVH